MVRTCIVADTCTGIVLVLLMLVRFTCMYLCNECLKAGERRVL